jgi:glycosyltransferase involved in cell wall biosynthesis
MRVALITENFLPKLDGVTRTLAMLLDHLRERGHQAIVLGPEGAPRRYAGFRIYGVRGIPLPFYPELRALIPSFESNIRLSRFHPDIVHVADPMLLGAAGIAWAQRVGVPLVASYHTNLAAYCSSYHLGALQPAVWAYRRMLHNRCGTTLCPSPSTARVVVRRGFADVRLWPRGVDAHLFTPARRSEAWRRLVADDARQIVLYVGRLSHEKNLAALVAAFATLEGADALADTHLVLVGDGPARTDLERALSGRRVTFTGYLCGAALAEAYASSDVFAFPSVTETFGQVVLEAMASGLPILGFDAEGVCDLVRPGVSGLLAPVGAIATFARSLAALLESAELRRTLGRQARAAAERRTWSSVMDSLLLVYLDVIERYQRDLAA